MICCTKPRLTEILYMHNLFSTMYYTCKTVKSKHILTAYRWLKQLTMTAINDRPVRSSKRAPPSTKLQMSDSNKTLVLGPRWGLTPGLTGRLTVSRNVTSTLTYGATNVAPSLKDRPLPSSKRRPHFSNTYMSRREKILVKSLDETWSQEWLCWRGSAAI
jgi:hypothetical protein